MVTPVLELERINHLQSVELCREERRFLARLHNLSLLRRHCNELYQQRDKIEKLSSLHDRLLQQEFSLRKLRRIRSEVDTQRQKNEKLAKELGKVKDELEEKETKLQTVKTNMQKVITMNNEKHKTEIFKSTVQPENRKPSSESYNGGSLVHKTQVASNEPIVIMKPVVPTKPIPLMSNLNGKSTNSILNATDNDELVTSFITGWAPSTKFGTPDARNLSVFPRHSASDVELSNNGTDQSEDNNAATVHGENVRPASDFISHASLPAYRYVPRTQTFLRRIGVDGGRKKTVESLYKDFHPRALQSATTKSAPVSIIDEAIIDTSTSLSTVAVFSTVTSVERSNNVMADSGVLDKELVRPILVQNKTTTMRTDRHVRFDPLALLLDSALDGDLDLVKQLLQEVPNPSAANDEGITALHNAICAGHSEMVQLLVEYGVDVNASDTDGWTGLHCAASCNNRALCQLLVENGAALLALTTPDRETARDKCEPDEDGFAECYAYLLEAEEQLGRVNNGVVYAAFDFAFDSEDRTHGFGEDVLQFNLGSALKIMRRGDDIESDWWWARLLSSDLKNIDGGKLGLEGYVPNSYLALYSRNQSYCKRFNECTSKNE